MRALKMPVILAVGLLALPAAAQQRSSVVGKWSTAAGRCVKPLSIVVIGPKSLSGEDFGCEFDTVSRQGDVVTWRGKCTFGGDDPVSETVQARLAGNRLHYRFMSLKGENGPFVRCR